jgi:hypothetical protein
LSNLPGVWTQSQRRAFWIIYAMTPADIEQIRQDMAAQKDRGYSSKAALHFNKLETVLDLAAKAAAMSELENSAARRHMERHRQARRAA